MSCILGGKNASAVSQKSSFFLFPKELRPISSRQQESSNRNEFSCWQLQFKAVLSFQRSVFVTVSPLLLVLPHYFSCFSLPCTAHLFQCNQFPACGSNDTGLHHCRRCCGLLVPVFTLCIQ